MVTMRLLFLIGLAAMALSPWYLLAFVLLLIGGLGSYYDGTIARAADPAAVAPIAAVLAEAGIAAVAICFLHAYANDLSLTESELYYCRKARARPQRPAPVSSGPRVSRSAGW
jgi:N-methylhydantoinase A/oxoprolinase/acetone carboxylase beta subunit